ncbi:Uncharacterized protein Rs2_35857 [Raphanus sativus]|nr:Uncharacterized protein Rs2_35857 [Raphanus sativus]
MQHMQRIEDDITRRHVCAMSAIDLSHNKARELREQTGTRVAAVVISETGAQYASSSAVRVFGQNDYEHWDPLASEQQRIPMFRNLMMSNWHCWCCRPMRPKQPLRHSRTSVEYESRELEGMTSVDLAYLHSNISCALVALMDQTSGPRLEQWQGSTKRSRLLLFVKVLREVTKMADRKQVEDVKPTVDTATQSRVLGQHGNEPRDAMAQFRATKDPDVKKLDNDQLALLLQRTNEARAAIAAELNRRLNN